MNVRDVGELVGELGFGAVLLDKPFVLPPVGHLLREHAAHGLVEVVGLRAVSRGDDRNSSGHCSSLQGLSGVGKLRTVRSAGYWASVTSTTRPSVSIEVRRHQIIGTPSGSCQRSTSTVEGMAAVTSSMTSMTSMPTV